MPSDDAATCITNDVTAKSLFDVLYPQQTQLKRCLPPTITQFELPPVQLKPLDTEEFERRLRSCLQQNFIDKLKPLVEQQLKYVKNVKSLTNIKTQLLQMVSFILRGQTIFYSPIYCHFYKTGRFHSSE